MAPVPQKLTVLSKLGKLRIGYADGNTFELSFEYLRTHSSSAEVQGHGGGQQILQIAKENVGLTKIEPVGNYAVRLISTMGMTPVCSPGSGCTAYASTKPKIGSCI